MIRCALLSRRAPYFSVTASVPARCKRHKRENECDVESLFGQALHSARTHAHTLNRMPGRPPPCGNVRLVFILFYSYFLL